MPDDVMRRALEGDRAAYRDLARRSRVTWPVEVDADPDEEARRAALVSDLVERLVSGRPRRRRGRGR